MPDSDDIAEQQRLLKTHRDTLSILLQQQAMHGVANVPPAMVHGILEARKDIKRIKKILRSWGASVPDHPNDENERAPLSPSSEIEIFKIESPYQLPNPSPIDFTKIELPYRVSDLTPIDLSKIELPYQLPNPSPIDFTKIELPYRAPDLTPIDLSKIELPYQLPDSSPIDFTKIELPNRTSDLTPIDLTKIELPYQLPDLTPIDLTKIDISDWSSRLTEITPETDSIYKLSEERERHLPETSRIVSPGISILVLGVLSSIFSYFGWLPTIWTIIIFSIGILVIVLGNYNKNHQ